METKYTAEEILKACELVNRKGWVIRPVIFQSEPYCCPITALAISKKEDFIFDNEVLTDLLEISWDDVDKFTRGVDDTQYNKNPRYEHPYYLLGFEVGKALGLGERA